MNPTKIYDNICEGSIDGQDNREATSRSRLLMGEEGMKHLQEIKVAVFGIGGVGSWVAEALVRTGVRHITLVDADVVAPSNINRQAPACWSTVGEMKTEVMRRMLLAVAPDAEVEIRSERYTADTQQTFHLDEYDYIIDAIDSLADKALLICNATRCAVKLFSSMGAALKMDPTRIRTAEFWDVKGCRLAAALRHKFKKSGIFPGRKFRCVYSDELLPNQPIEECNDEQKPKNAPMTYGKVAVNGSLCHITAVFGMVLAGMVIEDIYRKSNLSKS